MGGTRATASALSDDPSSLGGAPQGSRSAREINSSPPPRRPLRGWILSAPIAFLIALSSAAAAAPATRPTTRPATRPVDPDLFAWWSAARATAEQAPDASGKSHPAKPLAGKLAIETIDGRTAFRIKAGAGALTAGTDPGFDFTGDFSVALRVRLAGEQTDVTMLGKWTEAGTDGWAIGHGIKGFGGIGFAAAPDTWMPTSVRAGAKWVHVTVTFHRRDFLLYVDGKAIGIAELPVVPRPSKQPLIVGAGPGGKGGIDGWVDDVRIYHRALTADDVEALAAEREPTTPYRPIAATEQKRIDDLVAKLGADASADREAATAALKAMGRTIYPMLRARLTAPAPPEVTLRLREILCELPPAGSAEGDQ